MKTLNFFFLFCFLLVVFLDLEFQKIATRLEMPNLSTPGKSYWLKVTEIHGGKVEHY